MPLDTQKDRLEPAEHSKIPFKSVVSQKMALSSEKVSCQYTAKIEGVLEYVFPQISKKNRFSTLPLQFPSKDLRGRCDFCFFTSQAKEGHHWPLSVSSKADDASCCRTAAPTNLSGEDYDQKYLKMQCVLTIHGFFSLVVYK